MPDRVDIKTFDQDSSFLEDVEGERALAWVRGENERTQKQLEADVRFKPFLRQVEKIVTAKDRIPFVHFRGESLFNFWRDEKSVRGRLRKTSRKSYLSGSPKWQLVLDLDKLARDENENWVYHQMVCLPNEESRCLISLSRGGKDAHVAREFDLKTKRFVEGGFSLPEAKSDLTWWSKDIVLVGTDWGEGSLTESGYARQVRVWHRGQSHENLPIIFEAEKSDLSAYAFALVSPDERHLFISRRIDFYHQEISWVSPDFKQLIKIPLPLDAEVMAIHRGRLILSLRQKWAHRGKNILPGDVVAFDFSQFLKTGDLGELETLFRPGPSQAFSSLAKTRDSILLSYLDNVQTQMEQFTFNNSKWEKKALNLPKGLTASVVTASPFQNDFFLQAESFLEPTKLLHSRNHGQSFERIMQTPKRFNDSGIKIEQHWVKSRDGTLVPYFEVGRANSHDALPTLLTAYGGFEVSNTPLYSGGVGKLWLERGGRYVVANIRGGGEFGPPWHQAVLKNNRPKVFEDFIAVAEDLIRRGRTTSAQLGIRGGSNGGLLVSGAMTKRPDLFKAVICQVPLTDMLNYHRWLAGASWMGEYGDPSDPQMRKILLSYSPLHNLHAETVYPEIFFVTSTKDDRVDPAHARKMAYRMRGLGKPFLYFENIEGGHGAAANLNQMAYRSALEFVYLSQKLGLN